MIGDIKLIKCPSSVLPIVIDCGVPPSVTNGSVDTSGGTTYKCTAVYTCNVGHVLNGPLTRTCQVSGDWSGSGPTCDSECVQLVMVSVCKL